MSLTAAVGTSQRLDYLYQHSQSQTVGAEAGTLFLLREIQFLHLYKSHLKKKSSAALKSNFRTNLFVIILVILHIIFAPLPAPPTTPATSSTTTAASISPSTCSRESPAPLGSPS